MQVSIAWLEDQLSKFKGGKFENVNPNTDDKVFFDYIEVEASRYLENLKKEMADKKYEELEKIKDENIKIRNEVKPKFMNKFKSYGNKNY